MMRRYIAFDIETAKVLPEAAGDLLAHRPLGIACAAAVLSDSEEALTWHGIADGKPSARMSEDEARSLVRDLSERVRAGYTLLSWNGLAFDLNVLGEESGQPRECAVLARAHVDMMFHVVCQLGYHIALAKAAEGLGLPGKTAGISGYNAPVMWAEGRHAEVMEYNVQDARLSLAIAHESERRGELVWVTRKGTRGRMPIGRGWLTVDEARALPLPDTSWMSDPPRREKATAWFPTNTSA
jgi:hypothetical protein